MAHASTNFDVGDYLYYMDNNCVVKGKVTSIKIVLGKFNHVSYFLSKGALDRNPKEVQQERVSASKQQLLESL